MWRGEIIKRRNDSTLYTEEQSIRPLRDLHGKISHFIAVKQDVTERRRTEEESRQRAQLSALGAALGLSLANGVIEFDPPLA